MNIKFNDDNIEDYMGYETGSQEWDFLTNLYQINTKDKIKGDYRYYEPFIRWLVEELNIGIIMLDFSDIEDFDDDIE